MRRFLLVSTFVCFLFVPVRLPLPAHDAQPGPALDRLFAMPTLASPRDALADSLHDALWRGDSSRVAHLLERGAPPDSLSMIDGYAPLHRAAEADRPDLAALLLKAGADPNGLTRNARGNDRSPLHIAAERGSARMVTLLLDAGASVASTTAFGETPLHGVRTMVDHPAVVAALLRHGADPNAATVFGATPVHHAARTGSALVMRMLLDAGGDPLRPSRQGYLPLHLAAREGYTGVVALLLDRGTPIDLADAGGQTALDHARARSYPDIVHILTRRGAVAAASAGDSRP